jgi:hypothetical protein
MKASSLPAKNVIEVMIRAHQDRINLQKSPAGERSAKHKTTKQPNIDEELSLLKTPIHVQILIYEPLFSYTKIVEIDLFLVDKITIHHDTTTSFCRYLLPTYQSYSG